MLGCDTFLLGSRLPTIWLIPATNISCTTRSSWIRKLERRAGTTRSRSRSWPSSIWSLESGIWAHMNASSRSIRKATTRCISDWKRLRLGVWLVLSGVSSNPISGLIASSARTFLRVKSFTRRGGGAMWISRTKMWLWWDLGARRPNLFRNLERSIGSSWSLKWCDYHPILFSNQFRLEEMNGGRSGLCGSVRPFLVSRCSCGNGRLPSLNMVSMCMGALSTRLRSGRRFRHGFWWKWRRLPWPSITRSWSPITMSGINDGSSMSSGWIVFTILASSWPLFPWLALLRRASP